MTWMMAAPAALMCVLALYGPGTVVLLAGRVPPARAILGAPAVSLAVLLIASLAARPVGAPWGWGVVGATTAVAVVIGAVLGLWRRRPGSAVRTAEVGVASVRARRAGFLGRPAVRELGILAAYLLGTAITAKVLLSKVLLAFQHPDSFAQRFDNAFHLNAIEFVLRTGDASPFSIGPLAGAGFYPSGWHQIVSLAAQTTGASSVVATQACSIVLILLVWPVSVSALVETVLRPGAVARIVTPALALGFAAFPWVLFSWGLVYPNILGFALAPGVIALVIRATRPTYTRLRELVVALVLVGAAVLGLTSAHPNAVITAMLLLAPYLVVRAAGILKRRSGRRGTRLVQAIVMAAVAVALPLVWAGLAPTKDQAPWTPYQSIPQSIGEALLGGFHGIPVAWIPSLLLILGILALSLSRGRRWAMVSFVLAGAVFVSSTAAPEGPFRDFFAGPYYRDNYRVAAVVVMVLPLLAAAGADALVGLVSRVIGRAIGRVRSVRLPRAMRTGAAMIVGTVIGALGAAWVPSAWLESDSSDVVLYQIHRSFDRGEDADLVSADEFAVMSRIPQHVPEGEAVVVDPWQGGGLVYALGNRDVTEEYMFAPGDKATPDEIEIRRHLRDAASNPDVCRALEAEGATYFFQADPQWVAGVDSTTTYRGFVGIDESTPGFELVDRQGHVALYRITACEG